jgi:hypothetical protein
LKIFNDEIEKNQLKKLKKKLKSTGLTRQTRDIDNETEITI